MEVAGDGSIGHSESVGGGNDGVNFFEEMLSGVSLSSLMTAIINEDVKPTVMLSSQGHPMNVVPSHFLSHHSDYEVPVSDCFAGKKRQLFEECPFDRGSNHCWRHSALAPVNSYQLRSLECFPDLQYLSEPCRKIIPVNSRTPMSSSNLAGQRRQLIVECPLCGGSEAFCHYNAIAPLNCYRLPPLRSLEHFSETESPSESRRKLIRVNSQGQHPPFDLNTLDSILTSFNLSDHIPSLIGPQINMSARFRSPVRTLQAKSCRQRISERIYRLAKLLPGNRKMDIATTLEEAYKYVKFLNAQVTALQAMPTESSYDDADCGRIFIGGRLERLNRQRLLQVVVNSPDAQLAMSSFASCVVSVEQVALAKRIASSRMTIERLLNAFR
ncbi:hypothetical protein Nepgr_009029 [Nepenthes gracilis]|uniref:BHLH domain-containing protein n=1 Tax=Nepenthes gracilis TaxID=150966 RepID=A0AAD3SA85_NEPGR|nr:hypothetical protein Nepgr_009029 [Nepenthes gracilis]